MALPIGMLAQGTTWQTATTINSGETISGTLDKDNQDAWFKVVLPDDGDVTFVATSDDNLVIRYISINTPNSDGTNYSEKDYIYLKNGEEPPFTVKGLKPDTYYIRLHLEKGEGAYTLKYNYTPCSYSNDPEPNNVWSQTSLLESGKTVQGRLGYKTYDSGSTDQDDWYKIELPDDGSVKFDVQSEESLVIRYISINTLNSEGTNYSEKEYVFLKDGEEPPFMVNDLKAGTYYIRLHLERGYGGYNMKYAFTPCSHKNDPEPNDEWTQASLLENGQTVQGHLGYWHLDSNTTDMDDWYQIELPEDGAVTFDVKSEETLVIRYVGLYPLNGDGTDVYERGYQYLVEEEKPYTVNNVAKGTYWVRLHFQSGYRYYGGYTLKYTFTPNGYQNDEEPNNNMDHAVEIEDGQSLMGHLGYEYNNNTDVEDWYKVNVAGGGIVTFTIEPDTATLDIRYIELFTSSRSSKGYIYVHKEPGTLAIGDLKDGTYYLQVKREGDGGYGGYRLTCGAPKRIEGSQIRVSTIGRNTTRLGIPSPMEVKVENIGSGHTGSFFIAIPSTPDIEFLRAELPTDEGVMELGRDDFAIFDATEGDCAAFIMPDLGPFESYTFKIYTQGRLNSASRSNSPRKDFSLPDKAKAWLAALKSSSEEFVENMDVRVIAEDGVTVATVQACIDATLFDKKDRVQMSKAIGGVPNDYKQTYRKPVPCPVIHYTQKVVEKINPIMAVPNALVASGKIANSLITALRRKIWLWIYKDLGYVQDDPQVMDGQQSVGGIVRSWDPNEMCGPVGYGDENYIADTKTMDYRILFENKKEATAPAYRIRISDELDPNVFDLSSVRFGGTSHEGVQYDWKMTREGNKLLWDIEGIELPPNVNAPEGEGYVTFSVDLKPDLPNGTQIKNKAAIIFDYNETIETNEFVNTLDKNEPVARMTSASERDGIVTVKCEGSDGESGVSHYLFYASTNGNDFLYVGQSSEKEYAVKLNGGSAADMKFYALAVDNVGNTQQTPPAAITVTSGNSGNGDANCDGEVNVADVLFIIEKMGEAVNETNKTADVNDDDEINVADVVFVIKRIQ